MRGDILMWGVGVGGQQQQNNCMGEKGGQSKMEAAFVASSTLKRNRRYLDIEKINELESESQVKRRRPLSSTRSIHDKINHSFSNSTTAFTERREKDIHRFKQRHSTAPRPNTPEPTPASTPRSHSQQTSRSAKSVRGVAISQHLSREQYYKTKSKPVLDERLFNNYVLQEPDISHTADLGRGPERDFDNSLKHVHDIGYQTQQLFQEYYYKRTTMDCRFHYKTQKQQPRHFFIPKRSENMPATELSPKAVKLSHTAVNPRPGPIDSFYMNTGRELPCQLQARTGTALTSHWRDHNDVIVRPQVEYSVRCMKDKLEGERKERILGSKKPHFTREEICDKKFFIFKQE